MKKILNLLLLCTVLGFVACDNEDPTPSAPTVTLDPTSAQNIPGASVTVNVVAQAPAGAKEIVLSGGVSKTVTLSGEKSVDEDVDVTIPANAVVGTTIPVVITLTDNKNQSSAPVTF